MLMSLLPLIGTLLGKLIPDTDLKEKVQSKLGGMLISGELARELEAAKIVRAEASSEHWFVAAWRPALMWICIVIIGHEYLLQPYLAKIFGGWVRLGLNQNIWDLIYIGLGGYIVGRSGEKIAKTFKKDGGYGYSRKEDYDDS